MAMRTRRLGRTNLQVSEIGFGAWGIGGAMWQGSDDESGTAALRRALELGINFFDTALAYGDGHSEKLIAQVLATSDQRSAVATKIPPKNGLWPAHPGIPMREVFPFDYVRECTEQSIQNLGTDKLDLQQFHVWNPEWASDPECRKSLAWLKLSGKARFVGISVNDHQPESVITTLRTGLIDTVQVIYNIFDQSPGDVLFGVCQELDIGVIARVPFDEGGLTGKITPETRFSPDDWRNRYFTPARRREVAERVQKLRQDLGDDEPLTQTALRFCLTHPAVSTVIPGMRSVRHVESNAAAPAAGRLPAATMDVLRHHRWARNFYSE